MAFQPHERGAGNRAPDDVIEGAEAVAAERSVDDVARGNAFGPRYAHDASDLQAMLSEAFDWPPVAPFVDDDPNDDDRVFRPAEEPEVEEPQPQPVAKPKKEPSKWRGRIIKSAIGLLFVAFAVWTPARQLFQVASTEAVVNAQIVTLRAPIEGTVDIIRGTPGIGTELAEGATLLQIANPRADLFRVNEAVRAIDQSLQQRAQIVADLDSLLTQQAALFGQIKLFHAARIEYLTALIAIPDGPALVVGDVDERVPFLRARLGLMNPDGMRANVFDDELDSAVRAFQESEGLTSDGAVGAITRQALNGEVIPEPVIDYANLIELNALRRGVFIGDSYNDKPSSGQRLDAIEIEIARLQSELQLNIEAHARLLQAEKRERAWVGQLSTASLSAPVDGRIWEVLTAPGEQVVVGQELIRMLDCANPLVTAVVSEAVYNQLAVGMTASFTFREGGDEMIGNVVQLTGFAAAPANLAIEPSSLQAESYKVTVSVPAIAAVEGCAVGRTGRIVFNAG